MHNGASDWLAKTEQGVLPGGGDITDAVTKRCPFLFHWSYHV